MLKQKKMYESQIDQLQQQSFNMEQTTMTTDNLRNTMGMVEAMKSANKVMKKEYGKLNIDKIEVRLSSCVASSPFAPVSSYAWRNSVDVLIMCECPRLCTTKWPI